MSEQPHPWKAAADHTPEMAETRKLTTAPAQPGSKNKLIRWFKSLPEHILQDDKRQRTHRPRASR